MKMVVASGNRHKIEEIQVVLPDDVTLVPQTDLGIAEVAETGLTFVENAILKARNAAAASGLPAIADDSGLEVDWLEGAPGIRSARFAGDEATDRQNIEKLLDLLDGVSERSAKFRCVIVMMRHAADPMPTIATGTWHGEVIDTPRGTGGFGYDPVFYLPDVGKTVAELPPAEKHRMSHRGQALAQLQRQWETP